MKTNCEHRGITRSILIISGVIIFVFLLVFQNCEEKITDNVAPEVSIVLPTDGSTIGDPNLVTIRALATDNEQVAKVKFYIDGELLDTDDKSPYEIEWNAGFWVAEEDEQHSISAIAVDESSNSSALDLITVMVCNDAAIIPYLIYPQNGEDISGNNFQFKWNKIPQTEKYLIEIATNNEFESSNIVNTANLADTVYDFPDLDIDTYFWRLRAKHATERWSKWSDFFQFSVHSSSFFSKTFGGSDYDVGSSVQQTMDGGFIIAGTTESYGAGRSDVWLIKTDVSGNKVWDKTFGGSDYDGGYSVQQTVDGGFIIAGTTESYGAGESDVWLIKTDVSGNKVWDQTFGGSDYDGGSSVQQTMDGGFIIAGRTGLYSYRDILLIKTDASGNKVWDQTFGGSDYDGGNSVQQTMDGGFIITGYTNASSFDTSFDVWLIKTDASGNKVWDQTFGGSGYDCGESVQQTTDEGFIIAGSTSSYGSGSCDILLIKTDASGNKVWDQTFGGSDYDGGYSVQQTVDGGFIIAGETQSWNSGSSIWLIKADANGNKVWDQTFGGTTARGWGNSVQQTKDGGFIVVGGIRYGDEGDKNIWLIKTDANGEKK